jgi:hypothetical protein
MIYEIYSNEVPTAIRNGCNIIILSADSSKALVEGLTLTGLNIISEYSKEEINNLLSNPIWKQPCKDCEA